MYRHFDGLAHPLRRLAGRRIGIAVLGELQAALLGLTELLVAIVFSHLFLGESLSTYQVVGAIILALSQIMVAFDRFFISGARDRLLRALRNRRIQGLSSPQPPGVQLMQAERKTRSGCGIRIVKRPSAVVRPAMPSRLGLVGALGAALPASATFDRAVGVGGLTVQAGMEAILYKLDGQGGSVWSRRWNGTGGVLGRALAVGAGSVVVVGNYRGEVDGDPGVGERVLGTEGGVEGFLVKLDSAGTYGWSHRFGGSGDESLTSVAVDERGGVYVGGMFHGEVDLDPGSGTAKQVANGGGEEGFVVKLESTGAYAWSKVFGGAADDHVQSVAVDRTGDVYLGGYYSGVVDFDPGMGEAVSASSGGLDAFVVKLTTTGTIRVDTQAPQVAGVSRRMPLEASVTATSVAYRVRFSREVSGVDAGDFSATTTGGLTGEVTAVAAVNASEYVVAVGNLKGSGTVRLDLKATGTGIADLSGNALTGGYTQGETYTVTAATTQPELGGSASAGGIYGSTFNYTVTASRAPQGYTVSNSHLSEYAVLGFELGYTLGNDVTARDRARWRRGRGRDGLRPVGLVEPLRHRVTDRRVRGGCVDDDGCVDVVAGYSDACGIHVRRLVHRFERWECDQFPLRPRSDGEFHAVCAVDGQHLHHHL